MQVSDILKGKGSGVVTIGADKTLQQAVDLLMEKKIGSLLVQGGDGAIAGILTERDILRECSQHPGEFGARKVGDAMTREVFFGKPEDRVRAVQQLMTERRIRHLPIVREGQLAGMISIGDVMKALFAAAESENYDLRGFLAEKNVVA